MYHYVYRLDHIETGEFYIGSRTSKVHPSLDNYLGSMVTWKPDKTKLKKTVIKDNFENREDLIKFESTEIKKVIKNDLNRNYHIPSYKFYYDSTGKVTVKDKNGNFFNIIKNDPRFLSGELTIYNKGVKMSDEQKKKLREINISKQLKWYHNDVLQISKLFSTKEEIDSAWVNGRKMYNYIVSDETRKKMRIAQKNQILNNPNHTFKRNTKGELNPSYGKHLSDDTKTKISNNRKGKTTKENHPKAKSVVQLDLNYNFIKKWNYIGEASDELHISCISRACRKQYGNAGNFKWVYEKDYIEGKKSLTK